MALIRRTRLALCIGLVVQVGASRPAPAHSQSSSPPLTLDFDSFVSRASAESPLVRTVETEANAAAARTRLASAPLLPHVETSLGVVRNDREIRIGLPALAGAPEVPPFQHQRTVRAAVEAGVALVDTSALAQRRAAMFAREAANANVEARRREVARAAVEVFAAAAEIEARRAAVAASIEALGAHLDRVEARRAAGHATAFDVERARAAELDARLAEAELAAAARQVSRSAAALLGTDAEVTLVGPLGVAPEPSVDSSEAYAAGLAVDAARLEVRAARNTWAPRVLASAGAAWTDTEAIDGEHGAWSLGLALRWTAFAGRSRPSEVAMREAAAEQRGILAREAEREAARRAAQGEDDVALSRERLELLRVRADVADRAAELARVGLQEGAVSAADALDAELGATLAHAELAAGEVRVARAGWLAALGGLSAP